MFNKKYLHKIQDHFFDFFILISWLLIIISNLGISKLAPRFLEELDYYIRIYICLFLMWRFNPFRKHYEFTKLDRKIAFSAGLLIFTSTTLNQYVLKAETLVKNLIKN
jgi:hypothetical protein